MEGEVRPVLITMPLNNKTWNDFGAVRERNHIEICQSRLLPKPASGNSQPVGQVCIEYNTHIKSSYRYGVTMASYITVLSIIPRG
jgi:hypothetical protein